MLMYIAVIRNARVLCGTYSDVRAVAFGRLMPSASIATAIVFAVYIPPQAPAPGQALRTISRRVSSSIAPDRNFP